MFGRASLARAGAACKTARAALCRSHRPGRAAEAEGFAAVDALVALTILSTTLILSLGAVETSRRAALSADETRRANELLLYLIDAAPGRVGETSGRSGGFEWRTQVRVAAGPHMATLQICDRSAKLVSRRSGRRFSLASARLCKATAS